jgi:hypothetical protein
MNPSLYTPQEVSALGSPAVFRFPDNTLPLRSTECDCLLLPGFLALSL